MTEHVAAFRRCMEELDAATARRLWAETRPHLPPIKTDADALVMLHHARTQAESMPLKLRAYSHRWLLDRELPSGLPDPLKPRAERLYPRNVEAVGISVNGSPLIRPALVEIRTAMEHAVEDAFAERRTDPAFVSARMQEARRKTARKLFG